ARVALAANDAAGVHRHRPERGRDLGEQVGRYPLEQPHPAEELHPAVVFPPRLPRRGGDGNGGAPRRPRLVLHRHTSAVGGCAASVASVAPPGRNHPLRSRTANRTLVSRPGGACQVRAGPRFCPEATLRGRRCCALESSRRLALWSGWRATYTT